MENQNPTQPAQTPPPPAAPSEQTSSTILNKPRKGFPKSKLLILGAIVVIFIAGIGGAYLLGQNKSANDNPEPTPSGKTCTQEAKICPDGSAVGRTGPNCEFAECPKNNESSSSETADWKTFEMSSYSIKAPSEFRRDEDAGGPNFLAITNYDVSTAPGRDFSPTLDKGKLKVEIYQIETNKDLKSYVEEINETQNYIDTTVNGTPALKHTLGSGLTTPILIKDPTQNKIFGINFYLDFDNHQELANQILSTFKFTQ